MVQYYYEIGNSYFSKQPLRRLDPEQREDGRLQHPAQGLDHVRHFHRELDGDPRDFQTSLRTGVESLTVLEYTNFIIHK